MASLVIKYTPLCTGRKGHVTPDSVEGTNAAIRARIRARMVERGWRENDYARLGELVGMDRRQVRKLVAEGPATTDSVPASFLADLARAGFADAGWLLTGAAPPASDAEARLEAVRRLVQPGGAVDARVLHAVSLLLAAPGAERAEVDARLGRAADLLAELRQERRPDGRSSG
jgi:hypothetical protein